MMRNFNDKGKYEIWPFFLRTINRVKYEEGAHDLIWQGISF